MQLFDQKPSAYTQQYPIKKYFEGALAGKVDPRQVRDLHFLSLAADFAFRIPGAQVTIRDSDRLAEPLGRHQPAGNPGFLRRAYRHMGGAEPGDVSRMVVEVHCSRQNFEAVYSTKQGPFSKLKDYSGFAFEIISGVQDMLEDDLQIWHANKREIVFRIPSVTLIEASLQIPEGAHASLRKEQAEEGQRVRLFPAVKVESRQVNRLHREARHPVSFFTRDVYLGDVRSPEHAFVFAWHDIYHAVVLSLMPPWERRAGTYLYDAIRQLPDEFRRIPGMQSTLDVLRDLMPVVREGRLEPPRLTNLLETIESNLVGGLMQLARVRSSAELPPGSTQVIKRFYRKLGPLLREVMSADSRFRPYLMNIDFMARSERHSSFQEKTINFFTEYLKNNDFNLSHRLNSAPHPAALTASQVDLGKIKFSESGEALESRPFSPSFVVVLYDPRTKQAVMSQQLAPELDYLILERLLSQIKKLPDSFGPVKDLQVYLAGQATVAGREKMRIALNKAQLSPEQVHLDWEVPLGASIQFNPHMGQVRIQPTSFRESSQGSQ